MKNKLEEIRAQSLAAISEALDLNALDAVRCSTWARRARSAQC